MNYDKYTTLEQYSSGRNLLYALWKTAAVHEKRGMDEDAFVKLFKYIVPGYNKVNGGHSDINKLLAWYLLHNKHKR